MMSLPDQRFVVRVSRNTLLTPAAADREGSLLLPLRWLEIMEVVSPLVSLVYQCLQM